ncbi:MAG: glutamyl-tRNA reductase, partial [Actinomycetota bacterium]
ASKYHAGALDLRNFLSEFCHVAPEDFSDHLYTYHDDAAVGHLFRVAAGIDSMVIGESEILGQVRRAFQVAVAEASAQRALGSAFRRALRVGKRARTETAIGRNPVSISSAAVELAKRSLPEIAGKTVAIVGAGKMGGLAARALASAGATDITVVNRSDERAASLAAVFNAATRPWGELAQTLAQSDIVICSTASPSPVIDASFVQPVARERTTPLLIIDIAVPRDVAPDVGQIDGVILRDIDDLREVVDSSRGHRSGEIDAVERIVEEEILRWTDSERSNELAPTVAELVARADEIRSTEFARWKARAKPDPAQERAVDALSRRLIAKLLHGPVRKAKELPSSKQGYLYLSALRELFELGDDDDLDISED